MIVFFSIYCSFILVFISDQNGNSKETEKSHRKHQQSFGVGNEIGKVLFGIQADLKGRFIVT